MEAFPIGGQTEPTICPDNTEVSQVYKIILILPIGAVPPPVWNVPNVTAAQEADVRGH